ncbi:MAG: AAA family ATPase [Clostridiales bacterium]|nr:AAA family ATPase [Clostridiales bacterium]
MSKNISIDVAREMVGSRFNIGTASGPLEHFHIRGTGNSYEIPAPKEIRDNIVEIDGIYEDYNETEGTIALRTQDGIESIMPVQNTMYSASITEEAGKENIIQIGDQLSIIGIKAEDRPVNIAVTIIRLEEKWIFEQVKSVYGRANAIKNFFRLFKDTPGKREYILNQLRGRKYSRYDASDDILFDSKQEQLLKYALSKETYPLETQRAYEAMFRDSNSSKHKTDQKLSYLSRIAPTYKGRRSVSKKELQKFLDSRFYKMNLPKQQLIDVLVSNERAGRRGFNILLVGGPGVGKTSIMKAIADVCNIPSEIIPLNGMSCPLELEGLDSGYDNADAGRLIKVFASHGTSEMVIGFDEADKMNGQSKEGDPMNVLYRILLGEHEDKFLGCGISTENTIFIATANSVRNIPEPIKNRFNAIIMLEDYSVEDKMVIARKFIIPQLLKNFGLKDKDLCFSDEVLQHIITDYCEDGGARDLQHNIDKIIRRTISSENQKAYKNLTIKIVNEILSPLVRETQAIFFNRHRNEYSDAVANEIKRCLSEMKENVRSNEGSFGEDKKRQCLEYLLSCRNEEGVFKDGFDPVLFSDKLHENLYGMDKVIKEATLFYHTAFLQGTILNSNLALCGGFGIGKSTIARNIAEAIGYHFVKIPLNGIDDARELKGFSSTYVGSEPGRIMKGLRKAGSLKTVFQLDEIDKIKPEIATVLLDLLDREFTDNFLSVPVDFRTSIFIATANEWGNVPAVIRDRFIVVNVDGYSRKEKAEIVSDYIIPKIEKSYVASSVSVSIEDSACTYLLEAYCTSFGVRDAEKAMQRIVSSKLLEQAGEENSTTVNISKDDVRRCLGEEPIPRGNFPEDGNQPGISRALGVINGNMGSTFAIETVLVDGDETLEMTGLPRESATDSVKIAVTCIKKMFPKLLKGKHIHVHFGEGSVPKDGPSAGVALFMSIFSAAIEKPLKIKDNYDVAYTGEISLTGGVFAVGGVYEKLQAASDSGCRIVFVPAQNYEYLDKDKLRQYSCEVAPVNHITQVIEKIFPEYTARCCRKTERNSADNRT